MKYYEVYNDNYGWCAERVAAMLVEDYGYDAESEAYEESVCAGYEHSDSVDTYYEEHSIDLLEWALDYYLNCADERALPSCADAISEILQVTAEFFQVYNELAARKGCIQLTPIKELTHFHIAALLILYNYATLVPGDVDTDEQHPVIKRILVYQREGSRKGIYTDDLYSAILCFCPDATVDEVLSFARGVRQYLPNLARHRNSYKGERLVAVNNGIFDRKSKKLLPFRPRYMFESKLAVDYVKKPDGSRVMRDRNGREWDIDCCYQWLVNPNIPREDRRDDMPASWLMC